MLGVFIGPCALLTAFEPCDHIISHLVRMSFLLSFASFWPTFKTRPARAVALVPPGGGNQQSE